MAGETSHDIHLFFNRLSDVYRHPRINLFFFLLFLKSLRQFFIASHFDIISSIELDGLRKYATTSRLFV